MVLNSHWEVNPAPLNKLFSNRSPKARNDLKSYKSLQNFDKLLRNDNPIPQQSKSKVNAKATPKENAATEKKAKKGTKNDEGAQ